MTRIPVWPGALATRQLTLGAVAIRSGIPTPSTFWPSSLPHRLPSCSRPGINWVSAGSVLLRVPSARTLHSSINRASTPSGVTLSSPSHSMPTPPEPPSPSSAPAPPLSVLPLTTVIRSLMTTTISSSPFLLPPSLAVMSLLAHTTSPLLNPDRNPVLRFLVKNTFYAQFCAGEGGLEVRRTIDSLKNTGFSGVILGYAREVVLPEGEANSLASSGDHLAADKRTQQEIDAWAHGTTETVLLAAPGDFVALKFTGAGRQALFNLTRGLAPSKPLAEAIDHICQVAVSRGVRLLFDAEQQAVQAAIDAWTLDYMRKYNRNGVAIIYGTYQAYLKATPAVLSRHLAIALEEGFALGVKLVRGAYIGSDPRHLIHDTKADTDAAYDKISAALLRREWASPLAPPQQTNKRGSARVGARATTTTATSHAFPDVNFVLASHNRQSVRKARDIINRGESVTEVAFAQLQGMADEVSYELAAESNNNKLAAPRRDRDLKAYKYLVWGSTGECMKYLLRRAHENRDAVERTRTGREAMKQELLRRVKSLFGVGVRKGTT